MARAAGRPEGDEVPALEHPRTRYVRPADPSRDRTDTGTAGLTVSTSACLLLRAVQNQPYADLSAFCVACIVKNYRNVGGFGAESLEWIAANGVPTSQPGPSRRCREALDTPGHAGRGGDKQGHGMDGRRPDNIDQLVTCLLPNIPVVSDFNWWSHSVCTMDLVDVDPANVPGSLQTLILE